MYGAKSVCTFIVEYHEGVSGIGFFRVLWRFEGETGITAYLKCIPVYSMVRFQESSVGLNIVKVFCLTFLKKLKNFDLPIKP